MRFLCPRCSTSLPGAAGPALPADATQVSCSACGLHVDLALADTSAGRPFLHIVRDYSGEQVGPFALETCLGAGGMGTVYRGQDTRSSEVVAVKLLFPQLAAQPDLVQRFAREAAALRGLRHAHIVSYREHGTAGGHHYLAMEYVEGPNLEQRLQKGPLSREEALAVGDQICVALVAAHAHGIVHRDLKPANVILAAGGVKVLDFGIAHMAVDDLTLTRSDAVLGTVNYMAPEQRSGRRNADHRADLFALGVVLYRMLTGELPLGRFEPPSKHAQGVSRALDRVVLRLLSPDPDKRYPNAESVRLVLQRVRSNRRLYVAAAVVALALGAGGLAAAWSVRESGEKSPPPVAGKDAPPQDAPGQDVQTQADSLATPPQVQRVEPPVSKPAANAKGTMELLAEPDAITGPALGTRAAPAPKTRRAVKTPKSVKSSGDAAAKKELLRKKGSYEGSAKTPSSAD